VEPTVLADRLLGWERRMRERGSLDLLGPSTWAVLKRLREGVPAAEAGRYGSTNGAAMRITPVGIACDASDLQSFVDVVAATSAATHNTGLGIAAAAAGAPLGVPGWPGRACARPSRSPWPRPTRAAAGATGWPAGRSPPGSAGPCPTWPVSATAPATATATATGR
jgi:hypothetical protein